MMAPPADALALSGMALIALFAAWKLAVLPRIERRRARPTA